jgi:large subunit ribosomal protein L7/L12
LRKGLKEIIKLASKLCALYYFKNKKIFIMVDVNALAEQLVNLTVKEVNELAQFLKDKYGIEPAAAAVAVAAAPAAAEGGAAAAEKTEFDVILKSGGANKLNVIKEVKNILNLRIERS